MSERLIITLEVEDMPEMGKVLDFQMRIVEDGFLTRIFHNWKKVTYRPAIVTNMVVEKKPSPTESNQSV